MGYGDTARIKRLANVTYSDLGLADDEVLDTFIYDLNDQASEIVDDYCGRDFNLHGTEAVPVVAKLNGNGRRTIRLPGFPVVSVVSVSVDGTALTEGLEYEAVPDPGILERIDGLVWPAGLRNISVVYSHGYVSPPGAIVSIVEDLVVGALTHAARNRATKGASSMSMDGYSVAYSELSRLMVLAPEQMQTLDRYRPIGGA